MIKIDNVDIDNILSEYKSLLSKWLLIGVVDPKGNLIINKFQLKIRGNRNQYQKMLNFVYIRFDQIIEAKPTEFNQIETDFKSEFKIFIDQYEKAKKTAKASTQYGMFKATMESFYTNFFSANTKLFKDKKLSHGNWLTSKLGVNICPYCNRQYTFTITTDKTNTRPQFDHFKPKSKYPYLALTFYNLVPSCQTCNHLKREYDVDFHPYEKGFSEEFKFKLITLNNIAIEKGNYEIKLCNLNGEPNKNIDTLGLNPLYEGHRDYVDEILDKAEAYNLAYYNSLINSYKGLGKQASEIDRFVWGGYLEEAEHCKRPLSKLTRDVLEQLKIK